VNGVVPNETDQASMLARMQRFLQRGSAFERAIGLCAVAAIALVWIVVAERLAFEQSQASTDALRQAMNLATVGEQHALATLEDVEQTLQLVVRDYQRHGRTPRLQELFDNGAIASGLYNLFVVANERGDFVAASNSFAPTNIADRDFFRFHQQNPGSSIFVGKPVVERTTGQWSIPVTRRFDNADGSFGGVVIASIAPSYFGDFYRKIEIGDHGLIALVGLDGIARVTRNGERVDTGGDLRATAFFQALATNLSGKLFGLANHDEMKRYIGYRTLPHYPLAIEVGITKANVLALFSLPVEPPWSLAVTLNVWAWRRRR
jgi:hypothetical protein